MRSRVGGTALCSVAVLLVLFGCSADESADDPGSSTSGPAPAASDTAETAGTSATPVPVEPADGPTVEVGPMTYRLVDDVEWILSRHGQSAYYGDVEGGWYVSSAKGSAAGPDLDGLADVAIESVSPPPERLDDRVLAGVPCYVFERAGRDGLYYQVGAVAGSEWVFLAFEFPVDSPQAREWIEQVLASVAWT